MSATTPTAAPVEFALSLTGGPERNVPPTVTLREAGLDWSTLDTAIWLHFTAATEWYGSLTAGVRIDTTGPRPALLVDTTGTFAQPCDANRAIAKALTDALTDKAAVATLRDATLHLWQEPFDSYTINRRDDALTAASALTHLLDGTPSQAFTALQTAMRTGYAGDVPELLTALAVAIEHDNAEDDTAQAGR